MNKEIIKKCEACIICGSKIPGGLFDLRLKYCSNECRKESKVRFDRLFRIKNRDHIRAQKKEYHSRPEVKERLQKKDREKYINNKAEIDSRTKQYYSDNKERLLAKAKERYKRNKLEGSS